MAFYPGGSHFLGEAPGVIICLLGPNLRHLITGYNRSIFSSHDDPSQFRVYR